MSVAWLANVWEHSKATSNELLILLAIADFADKEGKAFPSLKVLAEKSRVSVREAQYSLRHLVEMGELKITAQKRENGSYTSNVYMIVLPTVHNMHHPPAQYAPSGARACTTLVHGDAPLNEPSLEPTNNHPPLTPPNGRAGPVANGKVTKRFQYPEAFETFWVAYPDTNDAKFTAYGHWKRLQPPLEQCLEAIAVFKKTDNWKRGYVEYPSKWLRGRQWELEES